MRFLLQVSLCCLLAGGTAVAQRGGGGARAGGFVGTGMRGGYGGGFAGGMRGGYGGGFAGGFRGTSFRAGFNTGFGFRNNFAFRGGFFNRGFYNRGFYNRGFYPGGYGLGFGFYGAGFYSPYLYDPLYAGFGYGSSYYAPYAYPYDYGYAAYQPSSNVTVVYPPQQTPVQPLSAERARPVTREYDQNGQEIRPAGSPLYLIAFKDHTIRAVTSYRVDGTTLHYMTPENEQKEVSLDTVDRDLSLQLNRERQVAFQLPPQ